MVEADPETDTSTDAVFGLRVVVLDTLLLALKLGLPETDGERRSEPEPVDERDSVRNGGAERDTLAHVVNDNDGTVLRDALAAAVNDVDGVLLPDADALTDGLCEAVTL